MSVDLRERFQVYASAAPSSAGLLEAVLLRSRRRRRRRRFAVAGLAVVAVASLSVAAPLLLRGGGPAPTGVGASPDVVVTTPPTVRTSVPVTTVESVRGTVVELLTARPVEGATVVVRDAADHHWETSTGGDGTFVVTGPVVQGDLEVTVTAGGYEPYSQVYAFAMWSAGLRVTLVTSGGLPGASDLAAQPTLS